MRALLLLLVTVAGVAWAQNGSASDGTTPLHWAVHDNDAAEVRRLIAAGANVNAKNDFGATPMSEAATVGNTAIIKMLLDAKADPDSPFADGQTALMVVARSTNVEAARLLIAAGANVNAKESQRNQTALMWAAAQRQPEMVKLLVSKDADTNARTMLNDVQSQVSAEPRAQYRSYGGLTPLMYATREGCLECAKALVEGGAKIDMPDPEGVTPLLLAITNFHFDTAKYLINAGANVDKWDWWGRSPLWSAVDLNTIPHGGRADAPSLDDTSSLEIIELLLAKGAYPNPQLKLLPPYRSIGADRGVDGMLTIGATPLLRAAKAADAPAIAVLLKYGALPDLPNNRGITSVQAAAGMGSVDADTRGRFDTSDVQQRSMDSLKLLLDGKGDLMARDSRGQTALHAAAFWGWNDVVKYLAERGADLNAKDNRGMTPIDSAMGRNGGNSRGGARIDVHQDTADLLVKLGATPVVAPVKPPAPAKPGR
jgi:ankyrin repeat protein